MASRRKARECALQMLFQWDLGRDAPTLVEELFWSNTLRTEDVKLRNFASQLYRGAVAGVEDLDLLIQDRTENWRLERMSAVDRNILRLGAYELTRTINTPPIVAINEALELARRYSGESSVQFINAILDSIRKGMEASKIS
jgi:N utilization substance protein B